MCRTWPYPLMVESPSLLRAQLPTASAKTSKRTILINCSLRAFNCPTHPSSLSINFWGINIHWLNINAVHYYRLYSLVYTFYFVNKHKKWLTSCVLPLYKLNLPNFVLTIKILDEKVTHCIGHNYCSLFLWITKKSLLPCAQELLP
jgi:hypothetical protein